MLKVYDFCCPSGHISEKFVQSGVTTSRCGCGKTATKLLSAPAFNSMDYKFLEPRFYFARKNINETPKDINDWKLIREFF